MIEKDLSPDFRAFRVFRSSIRIQAQHRRVLPGTAPADAADSWI